MRLWARLPFASYWSWVDVRAGWHDEARTEAREGQTKIVADVGGVDYRVGWAVSWIAGKVG